MNLSLRNRVAASFIVATLVVLILSFTVFHFLNSLNKEIEEITFKSNQVTLLTDEIRISAVMVLKYQRRILVQKHTPEVVEKLLSLCDSFTWQLQKLESYYHESDIKGVVVKMLSYVDSLKTVLSNASLFHRDTAGIGTVGELADKILDTYLEFQDFQLLQSSERDNKIKEILRESKRNMMITLIIAFLGSIILGLVIPGKIALPFKKIKDAIRELQENNFDVSIYYTQKDEIGEIAQEMNKMILSFKQFDELRTERIEVENRKFDVLANIIKKPILVADAEGRVVYMNNRLYALMEVSSEDVIGKELKDTACPKSIVSSFELALKRKSKIENIEVDIPKKTHGEKEENGTIIEIEEDGKVVEKKAEEKAEELLYKGFANIIPIRGKKKSMDYYLMVLSKEMMT